VSASGEVAVQPMLGAQSVLDQVDTGVVVVDRQGNLLYANAFAVALLGFPDDARHLVGQPLRSLGFEEADGDKALHLTSEVLRGRSWEGTFASTRLDQSRVFVRAQAAPLRDPAGQVAGIVIMAREASRGGQQTSDRIALLDHIGQRLSGSLELNVTLRQVADTLVPQFADHCLIDLYQGDKLVRRAQIHSRGWIPEPGTWAMVGEQIRYPAGHFCQLAMARMDTMLVEDLDESIFPAPSPASLQACDDAGLTSVIAAPLIARGELLGVMSQKKQY